MVVSISRGQQALRSWRHMLSTAVWLFSTPASSLPVACVRGCAGASSSLPSALVHNVRDCARRPDLLQARGHHAPALAQARRAHSSPVVSVALAQPQEVRSPEASCVNLPCIDTSATFAAGPRSLAACESMLHQHAIASMGLDVLLFIYSQGHCFLRRIFPPSWCVQLHAVCAVRGPTGSCT
jgi:hypothetical protein